VTSQGTAYGRFRRAIDARQVSGALAAAAELPKLTLEDALELCLLLAEAGDARYPRAARRWLARFTDERSASVSDSLIAAASLSKLADDPRSAVVRDTLEQLLEPPS
jgi:hypothetical protein